MIVITSDYTTGVTVMLAIPIPPNNLLEWVWRVPPTDSDPAAINTLPHGLKPVTITPAKELPP